MVYSALFVKQNPMLCNIDTFSYLLIFLRMTEYSLAVKAVVSQTVLHFASEKQLLDFPFYT